MYRTQDRRVELAAELSNTDAKPIAVLPGPRTDQFAIVSESGAFAVYEMP